MLPGNSREHCCLMRGRPAKTSGVQCLTPLLFSERAILKATCFRLFALFLILPCCALTFAGTVAAQQENMLPLMPMPAHIVPGEGQFIIDGRFGIALDGYTEPRLVRGEQRFLETLSRETGIPLWREAQFNHASFIIKTDGPSDPVQQLGEDESYHLDIFNDSCAVIRGEPARRAARVTDLSATGSSYPSGLQCARG